MNIRSHRYVIYFGLLCVVLLLANPVLASTSTAITISGVIPEPQVHAKRPVALFNTDPKVGPAPLTVTFTDKSQHNPTKWHWDFDDGTFSDVQNPPAHTYTQAGIYHVVLTATNSAGSDTGMRFVFTLPRFEWSGHGKGKNK